MFVMISQVSAQEPARCRVDCYFVEFASKNGTPPLKITLGDKVLQEVTAHLAEKVLGEAVKKANGILDLIGNLNTGNVAFHMNVVCIYRFVHNGKPTSKWKIINKNNLLNGAIDYFFFAADARSAARFARRDIKRSLDRELKKQCNEHK